MLKEHEKKISTPIVTTPKVRVVQPAEENWEQDTAVTMGLGFLLASSFTIKEFSHPASINNNSFVDSGSQITCVYKSLVH